HTARSLPRSKPCASRCERLPQSLADETADCTLHHTAEAARAPDRAESQLGDDLAQEHETSKQDEAGGERSKNWKQLVALAGQREGDPQDQANDHGRDRGAGEHLPPPDE